MRQNALSMLTDSFLDKQAGQIPVDILCSVLSEICIPLAGDRIKELREGLTDDDIFDTTMVEVELCIGLIFKPLRHHMKVVISNDSSVFLALWVPILNATKEILDDESTESNPLSKSPLSKKMTHGTHELTVEHLRNVIMVLSSFGILKGESEISATTWSLIEEMGFSKDFLDEWKNAAANPPKK